MIRLVNSNGLIVGTVVTVVDPTGQSISSAVLSNTTLAIHNNVNQRLAHNKPLKPIQVATSELTSGIVFQEREPQIWGSTLGAKHSRGLEGIALGYDHDYVGFTGGYEVSFYKARIGLLGGFVKTNIKTTKKTKKKVSKHVTKKSHQTRPKKVKKQSQNIQTKVSKQTTKKTSNSRPPKSL